MDDFSSFAQDVRNTLTWPGRFLTNTSQMLLRNARTCRIPHVPLLAGAALGPAGFIFETAGEGVATGVIGIASLYTWAFGSRESNPSQTDPSFIESERQKENFEPNRIHIAICGQTGSGKSSIANALRGIKNGQAESANTGTTETTTSRATYPAHETISPITLHDIPGSGTRRTPANNYYDNQKLFLFDLLLVVHSERLGEVDIDVVKGCISNKQPFLVVRSKSDISISNIASDHDLDQEAAKTRHINTSIAALRTEFEEAGVPKGNVEDLVYHCILVNKDALMRCVLGQAESVINELELVRFLSGLTAGFGQQGTEANA